MPLVHHSTPATGMMRWARQARGASTTTNHGTGTQEARQCLVRIESEAVETTCMRFSDIKQGICTAKLNSGAHVAPVASTKRTQRPVQVSGHLLHCTLRESNTSRRGVEGRKQASTEGRPERTSTPLDSLTHPEHHLPTGVQRQGNSGLLGGHRLGRGNTVLVSHTHFRAPPIPWHFMHARQHPRSTLHSAVVQRRTKPITMHGRDSPAAAERRRKLSAPSCDIPHSSLPWWCRYPSQYMALASPPLAAR